MTVKMGLFLFFIFLLSKKYHWLYLNNGILDYDKKYFYNFNNIFFQTLKINLRK